MSQSKAYLYRQIVQAKMYMDEHYADDLNLDHISGKAFFSKFHFIRLFKQIYGYTPHQYLARVRLEKAKIYLTKGRSVSDVCLLVGFLSAGSFTTLFKRTYGITPSAYQEQQFELTANLIKAPLKFIPNCFAEAYGWLVK
jgi:AraC-like DNA-binding protein